ncbi:MAG: alpha/beta hydrolase [Salinisphaeraceae bacterium]
MSDNASSPAASGIRSGRVEANGWQLAWEERGPRSGEPVLLIMGLGTQLLGWPEPFCDALAASGYRVIRFDNRDIGLSDKWTRRGNQTDVRMAFLRSSFGLPVQAPYTLADMAADTVGLINGLALGPVHLVGASMGGMIAQMVAADHPDRVRSLTSIMSTSGARSLPRGKLRVLMRMGSRPASSDRAAIIEHLTTTMRMIGSPGIQNSREQWAELIGRGLDRSYHPAGTARQLLAILASGSRETLLRRIRVPSLVIHGNADPLVPLAHGRHTAACIPDARLWVVPGMGHDLPPPLHGELAAGIAEHAAGTDRDAA